VAKAKKKLSLKKAVDELTAMAEKHLAVLPVEEQEARVAAFARRDFTNGAQRQFSVTARSRCDQ